MIDSSKYLNRAECLERYKNHLDRVRGLAEATQKSYQLIARRFLESLGSRRRIKHSKFTAAAVAEFVKSDAGTRRGQGPNTTCSATRSFIRFLVSEGIIQGGLEEAVPKMRRYRHADLPAYFSDLEIEQILTFSKDGSEKGIRNYALILLLSRFGLRVNEAAKLTLDDIDWKHGFVVIRAGKNRRERKLPLPEDVGQSLLHYIRKVRPKIDDRHIFLHWTEPFTAYEGSSLGKMVNRLLARAGVKRHAAGSHLFRHAAATRMVNHGASFKQIADLMGHQSLSATAIYAKLNFVNLAQIALDWPGGDS